MLLLALLLAVPVKNAPELGAVTKDLGKGSLRAVIKTGAGTIEIELLEEETPKTVAHFIGLARGMVESQDQNNGKWVKRKFYDGLSFHRRVPRFLIQGGCPRGDSRGGPGFAIADEKTERSHDVPGMVGLVRSGQNSGGSQFYITEVPAQHLDGKHTIFGKVVKGLSVVYAIARSEEDVGIEKVQIVRR